MDHTTNHTSAPSNDVILMYVVPGIVIALMLLLALILACILHRKQRAGKLHLFYSEALPPRDPVILKDEFSNGDQECLFAVGKSTYKDSFLSPCPQLSIQAQPKNITSVNNVAEMNKLLNLEQAPITIDPYSLKTKSRPSPIYKKRIPIN